MNHKAIRVLVSVIALAVLSVSAFADFRVNIPKRTKPTPVQRFNREGVKAAQKHRFEKAERLFYKAYLLDPDDPFTLNNLGYVSELQGKIDRAQHYYQLAGQQKSDTLIADSTLPELKGKPLNQATSFAANQELRVNRGNIEAMVLLQEGRTQEAEQALQRTLKLDERNPFTLNNLGYTMEAEGNLESAIHYYSEAANLHSSETIVVALDPHWRGKGISEVAENNVRTVQKRMETEQSPELKAARANLEGVFELNHNNPDKARNDFYQAYKLDPYSAFSLNNMGFVSEMNGDQETADEFYEAAKLAPGAHARVSAASHSEMQGMALTEVATDNAQDTEANLQSMQEARRRQGGPIQLRRRDNQPIEEPESPAAAPNNTQPQLNPNPQPYVPRPPAESTTPPHYVPRPPLQP